MKLLGKGSWEGGKHRYKLQPGGYTRGYDVLCMHHSILTVIINYYPAPPLQC